MFRDNYWSTLTLTQSHDYWFVPPPPQNKKINSNPIKRKTQPSWVEQDSIKKNINKKNPEKIHQNKKLHKKKTLEKTIKRRKKEISSTTTKPQT